MVQIDVPGKPLRSRGVPGSIFGLKHRRSGPKIFSPTAFRYPEKNTRYEVQGFGPECDPSQTAASGCLARCRPWSRHGQSSGYLKAVWLKIFGPVFRGFRPEIDPGTPLDRRGLPGTSICTKNQPRRPILRPFRGTQKLPPDCLQVPRSCGILYSSHSESLA